MTEVIPMSGLLDKANTAAQAASEEEAAAPPHPRRSRPKRLHRLLLLQRPLLRSDEGLPLPAILSSVGGIGLFVGLLLSLQGGFIPFFVTGAVLLVAVGAIVLADQVQGKDLNVVKTGGAVFLAVIIAIVPYTAGVVAPDGETLAISEVSLDEANDRLEFKVRGSFDATTVTISTSPDCDGTVE